MIKGTIIDSSNISERFLQLSVDTKHLLKNDPNELNDDVIKNIEISILELWRNLKIFDWFGSKSIVYLVGLSTRYSYNVLPKNIIKKEDVEIFALWLTIVWVIDGIFDKRKKYLTPKDKIYIKSITSYPNLDPDNKYLADIHTVYEYYLTKLPPSRSLCFHELQYWFDRYLETLETQNISSLGTLETPRMLFISLDQYSKFRLDSGAMMCVVWHSFMFLENIDITEIKKEVNFFRSVSLAVSYHNDILSLARDYKQNTPNLVTVISQGKIPNEEIIMKSISIVNNIYKDLSTMFKTMTNIYRDIIGHIGISITEGSYRWANGEQRYEMGALLVKNLLSGKSISGLVISDEETVGDPRS